MSSANREYVDRTCLHDEVCIYREEHKDNCETHKNLS